MTQTLQQALTTPFPKYAVIREYRGKKTYYCKVGEPFGNINGSGGGGFRELEDAYNIGLTSTKEEHLVRFEGLIAIYQNYYDKFYIGQLTDDEVQTIIAIRLAGPP